MHSALMRAWRGRGLVAIALRPLSWLYGALSTLRRLAYATGLRRAQRCRVPVIVVGNVVAGGAGKTPTVMAVVQHLRAQNIAVGVISRGFGRRGTTCIEVQTDTDPLDSGDEPLLIRQTTQTPVFVASTRHAAAQALLEKYPKTQILVCDDGLQHYGLYRDLEICVFDDRGYGNGWLLPSGPLRERWPRSPVARSGQRSTHLLVLHTGLAPAFAGHTVVKSLAPMARSRDGTCTPLEAFCSGNQSPLMAVAGIAQPESFFSMLRACDVPLSATQALPDHYTFGSNITSFCGGYQVICTEKDAAKLWPFVPHALSVGLVFKPQAAFFHELDQHIAALCSAKLSSTHGHQTS